MLAKVLLGIVGSLVVHLLLGWAWTILVAIGLGYWTGPRKGWLYGLLALGGSWTMLLLYNVMVASSPVQRLAETMSEILGGFPAATFYVLTLLVGLLSGALGGFVGQSLCAVLNHNPTVNEV